MELKTEEQPQPHASLRVGTNSAEHVEMPWEAIKPVQPYKKPANYDHSNGSVPPSPPVRTIESKLATASLSQSENSYHILPEGSDFNHLEDTLPHHPLSPYNISMHQPAYPCQTKGESVLIDPPGASYHCQRPVPLGSQSGSQPYRAESISPNLSFVSKSEPQIPYITQVDNRCNTLGPRSYHRSMKSRGTPHNAYVSPEPGHQGYSHDRQHDYPTIHRVHSLHVPSTMRSVPIQRTEVPPDDDMFLYHQPMYQCKAYTQLTQQSSQADYHVTQLQPYFENGRVQYRYRAYAGSSPLDAPYYDIDPYGVIRFRHLNSFSRVAGAVVGRSVAKAAGFQYLTHHTLPPGKEHSFVSRDMPPNHGNIEATPFLAWDPEESKRFHMHSICRESRAREKIKSPVLSQYDNVGLFAPVDISGYETLHLHSKSDPGKAVLLAAESKDGRCHSKHIVPDPDILTYMKTEKHVQGGTAADMADGKESSSKKCQSSHNLPATLSHSLFQQKESVQHVAKYETGEDKQEGDSRSKHWQQEYPSQRSFQPHYDGPAPDHHQSKVKTSSGYNYSDDHASAPMEQPGHSKLERNQSVREQQQCSQGKAEPGRDYLYQKHSTKIAQSHYDNLDNYRPLAQTLPPVQNSEGSGSYPTPGCRASHNNRAYSTALGQGAFIRTDFQVQRPETDICTE